ncbi:MAG: HU family DNA-binding protein [Bacteroidaceae bacterium]|nr:HU family DNA-binding protein [Bacteroidaceae bacterium]
MNEKLSFQNIADTLAKKSGVQKKVADTFSKAFFDTIVEALTAGETIKIKGLGTFKLVEVDDRESVNVSTGKRFVIPGYKKVAFTAEDRVVEVLNEHTDDEVKGHTDSTDNTDNKDISAISALSARDIKEESVKSVESVRDKKEVSVRDEQPQIEDLIQVPEPEKVETPQNAFAGIDMLISTPESVEEIRHQYEEAKAKMETAVEEARKANAEKMRLEKLLDRLEKNVEPEMKARHTDSTDDTAQEAVSVVPVSTETSSEETKRQEAFNRVMVEPPHSEEPEPQPKKTSKKRLWLTLLIILLVAILGVFIYLIHQNIEAVEKVTVTEKTAQPAKPAKPAKPTKPATPKADKDSLAKAQQADSIKAAPQQPEAQKPEVKKPAEEQQPERPKTHRMQRGESLTRISQKYYGTKDSVRAILRINTFANPDNIPVGAVVKLP